MKKRVFVAFEIPAGIRRRVFVQTAELLKAFPQLRVSPEKTEKLHLTLKFLGESSESEIKSLMNAIEITSNNFLPFSLSFEKTGVFPSSKRPRILWRGIGEGTKNLLELHQKLEEEYEDFGLRRSVQTFKPHLTAARIREPEKSAALAAAHLAQNFEPIGFEVSEICVFQSILQPTGSIYTKLKSFRLTENEK